MRKIKKISRKLMIFAYIIILVISTVIINTSITAMAANLKDLTKDEAIVIGINFLKQQYCEMNISYEHAKYENAFEIFDSDGKISSYIVVLRREDKEIDYVKVPTYAYENNILEFAFNSGNYIADIEKLNKEKGHIIDINSAFLFYEDDKGVYQINKTKNNEISKEKFKDIKEIIGNKTKKYFKTKREQFYKSIGTLKDKFYNKNIDFSPDNDGFDGIISENQVVTNGDLISRYLPGITATGYADGIVLENQRDLIEDGESTGNCGVATMYNMFKYWSDRGRMTGNAIWQNGVLHQSNGSTLVRRSYELIANAGEYDFINGGFDKWQGEKCAHAWSKDRGLSYDLNGHWFASFDTMKDDLNKGRTLYLGVKAIFNGSEGGHAMLGLGYRQYKTSYTYPVLWWQQTDYKYTNYIRVHDNWNAGIARYVLIDNLSIGYWNQLNVFGFNLK